MPNFGDSGKLKYSPDYPFLFSGEVFFKIGSCRILGGDFEELARPLRLLRIKNVKPCFRRRLSELVGFPPMTIVEGLSERRRSETAVSPFDSAYIFN